MPDIGDFADVGVIELLVKVGDTVKVEQSLITVESDKASMEIPSSHAGVVKALKVKVGDRVSKGSVDRDDRGRGRRAPRRRRAPAAAARRRRQRRRTGARAGAARRAPAEKAVADGRAAAARAHRARR